jgi:hypothetical protein
MAVSAGYGGATEYRCVQCSAQIRQKSDEDSRRYFSRMGWSALALAVGGLLIWAGASGFGGGILGVGVVIVVISGVVLAWDLGLFF